MKKVTIKILFLILPVVLVTSCKPTLKVFSDYDKSANFSSYKTFSLYYLVTSHTVSELNEERIWNYIRAEMTKKGYIENDQNPDLVVNAVSILKNKKYVTADSYGYGSAIRPYGYWGGRGVASGHTTFQTSNVKQGSLLIDVIDAKTNKLVWEGTGNAEFEKRPKDPDAVISKAVTKILAGFPESNINNKTAKH